MKLVMRTSLGATMLTAALVMTASEAMATDLDLICDISGTYTETQTSRATVFADGRSATGLGSTTGRARLDDQMRVEIRSDGGRVRFPAMILPPLNRADREGWFKITKLETSDQSISADAKLNIANNARITIDRHTGDIVVRAMGAAFNGNCEKAEIPAQPKF